MLSDEEKAVLKTAKENYGLTSAEQKILVNLIEKLSKETEELKEDKYGLEEEVQMQAKNIMICENALCKIQDKIKAKIEYQKLKGKNQILELEMNIEEYIKELTEWVNGERVSIHCIHKDKIKAKIEEIKEEKRHYLEINDEYNAQICDCIIEEYESLLEKE